MVGVVGYGACIPRYRISIFRVTERIGEARDKAPKTRKLMEEKKFYLDYGTYAKFRGKILKG